jgi:Tfp pilus assembly protein FimT
VLATLVCCIMIVNLNYFQPHRNLIVFWVEQLANLSATVKYLFAVVIAAGSGGGAGNQAAHLDSNDTELLGTLLIILDSCVYGFSLLAVLFILINVHTSLKKVRLQEKENRELAASTGDGRSHAIARRLSKTQVQPQPNRRASLRLEKPSERGLSAMIAHANDHVQLSKTKKMFGVGGGGGLKNLVLNAHKKHQTHSAVDKAEHDHDETLARHEQEIKKKSIDAHDRLTRRLIKRKSYSASNNVPKNSFGRKELPKGAGKKREGDDEVEVEVEVPEEEEKGKHKQQKRSLLPNPAVELKFNAKK